MKILVINGPNINMLGIREPDIYGRETYADLLEKIKSYADKRASRLNSFSQTMRAILSIKFSSHTK